MYDGSPVIPGGRVLVRALGRGGPARLMMEKRRCARRSEGREADAEVLRGYCGVWAEFWWA